MTGIENKTKHEYKNKKQNKNYKYMD